MNLRKYIYGHCISPVRIRVFDSLSGSFVVREVPCGKCLHCRNTHVNEWCTRLYAQSLSSQNVYFLTLDYAPFDLTSPVARNLAAETAAVYHNINITHSYGMHPLVLCKNHLQDFFKRLRRNTSKKFQYFACGEYGTHAGGKGFGRPHFHIILFTNSEFNLSDFERAWTISGYKIGRVDLHDLRKNGSFDVQNQGLYSSKYVFRYVCKYLQKSDFNFEKLSTIDFHRTYYRSLVSVIEQHPDLFTTVFEQTSDESEYSWTQYCKDYSPFTCCSKRPSIGLGYFNENVERFTQGDFRLFGLPKECPTAFPRYFLKKTKEHLCPFVAFSSESGKITSNSRIGFISSILHQIYSDRLDFAQFGIPSTFAWCVGEFRGTKCLYYGLQEESANFQHIPFSDLHMYDYSNNLFYQFNGYGYNIWRKIKNIGFVLYQSKDILQVLHDIDPCFEKLSAVVLKPFHDSKVFNESELNCIINDMFQGDYDKFKEEAYRIYSDEIAKNYKTLLLSNNSKLSL